MDHKRHNEPETGVSNHRAQIAEVDSNFGLPERYFYLIKKAEKIAAALYMIADKIKDNELIKMKLKETSCTLLEKSAMFVPLYKTSNAVQTGKAVTQFVSLFTLSHSYLKTAYLTQVVSSMNFGVIQEQLIELIKYAEEIESDESRDPEARIGSGNFFITQQWKDTFAKNPYTGFRGPQVTPPPHPHPAHPSNRVIHKGHSIGHTNVPYNKLVPSHGGQSAPFTPSRDQSADLKDRKDSRKKAIVDLLSKKSNLTVKDFLSVITDCSEKTIQRELIDMVESGVLKKEGERRWSRYSLAKA
ncbi:MAG: hypothetical protein V4526_03115 [Patescibacteria group bacterium]